MLLTSARDAALGTPSGPAQPGDWQGVIAGSFAQLTRLEFTAIRFARSGVSSLSSNTEVHGVHTDACLEHGFSIAAIKDRLGSVLATRNVGHGIWCEQSGFDVVHVTSYANGKSGIGRANQRSNRVYNSIAWGNQGGNFVGFGPGDVRNSCGGFSGNHGNFATDPQLDAEFVPKATSPCIAAAAESSSLPLVRDARDAPRISDGDFDGRFAPDMGAIERLGYHLETQGDAMPGGKVSFRTTGAQNGAAIDLLGFLEVSFVLPPFGSVLVGVQNLQLFASSPTESWIVLPIPQDPGLRGLRFGVQSLGIPLSHPLRAQLSNVVRLELL